MSLSGLVLGILNVVIVVLVWLLVGAVIVWGLRLLLKIEVDPMVRQLYIALVGAIALYMIVALLFGLPSIRVL